MTILILVFIGLTLLVLITGVIVMAKGGKIDEEYSNKLMMLRVLFQGIAVALIVILYFLYKHSN